jgi:FixJ family two-component response regulator
MLPGMSGLQVFDELLTLKSPLLVIFLSMNLTVPIAANYTKKGAFDCIEKSSEESVYIESVRQAMESSKGISQKLVSKREALKLWETLTPREKDSARVVRRGMLKKQAAGELGIEQRTVETFVYNIYKKLGLRGPTALDRFMRENDIE